MWSKSLEPSDMQIRWSLCMTVYMHACFSGYLISKHTISDTGYHHTNMAHASVDSINFLAESTGEKWPSMIEEATPINSNPLQT